jgi:hypothetical protein
MRALVLTLLLVGGCASDPCDGKSGTCLALTVTSAVSHGVDSLTISSDTLGAKTTDRKAVALPVVVAVTFAAGDVGPFKLHVIGASGGKVFGSGDVVSDLAAGKHGSATVRLVADGGGADMSVGDMSVSDLGDGGGVVTPLPDGSSCVANQALGCSDPMTLLSCTSDGMSTSTATCAYSCVTTPTPHCTNFYPSGAVTPDDFNVPNTKAISITNNGAIDGDNGTIDNVRAASADPTKPSLVGGVSYRIVNGVAVFDFGALTIPAGVTLKLTGSHPIALVSTGVLSVVGVIDARGYSGAALCSGGVAGPGGSIGSTKGDAGTGDGAGMGAGHLGTASGMFGSGGGGAGYGATGGRGANIVGFAGGTAGVVWGNATLVPLVGGSSGAGTVGGGFGGGGGGAVQLVSAAEVDIGGGSALGGVNVGGCGGVGGFTQGGSGGGSGGAILVEAPIVKVLANGVLAANGGGGGTAQNGGGAAGLLGNQPALGGTNGSTMGGEGGYAGNAVTLSGSNGLDETAANEQGGGGGGGVGRIRLNNVSGTLTPDPAATISPGIGTLNSAGSAPTTLGAIDIH